MKQRYGFWCEQYRPKGLGLRLKRRIEKKYLSILKEATGSVWQPGLRLLEIGPGRGFFAQQLEGEDVEYHCVEGSPALAEELASHGYRVECDLLRDRRPFPDVSFDVVYASHVVEHCDGLREAWQLLQTACECVRPGGFIMINAPDCMSHGARFWVCDYTHNFVTTPLRVRNMLADLGMEPVLSRSMVLGVTNAAARLPLELLFRVTPDCLFDMAGKLLVPTAAGGFAVFGRRNFSIVAVKSEAAAPDDTNQT